MATIKQYGALMRSQLGVRENPPDSNRVAYSAWYGFPGPWCQMFQNWAHAKLGMVPPGYDKAAAPKGSAYTPSCAAWFKARKRWSTTPKVGDLVYFDFPGDGVGRISHVGWVEAVNGDGSITTIEGNTDQAGGRTGGRVMRKTRRVGIVGYGRPNYTTTTTEEDDLTVDDLDRYFRSDKGQETIQAALAPLVENGTRRAVHALLTGQTGAWAHPDREGWEFYTPEARAAALLPLANSLEDGHPAPAVSGTFTITGSGKVGQ